MKNTKIATSIFLVVSIIVLINVLSDQLYFRLDFTEDKIYTLSPATEDILKGLEEPVTVKAYFTENLPPDIAKTRRDFQEMLVEYASISGGMLVYEFIDPSQAEEKEQEAMQNGVQPIMINVREKDQVKQQKAYLGANIQVGENSESIPFMQPGTAMEYALSTAIKKLSVIDKPKVGIIQGHGEPSLAALQQLNTQLSVLYDVQTTTLASGDLASFKSLLLLRPEDTLQAADFNALDEYLNAGGNLVLAFNRVDGDLSTARGTAIENGIANWLVQKGINVAPNFLVDANCAAVSVRQQQGVFTFNSQVQFPYLPIANNFAEHPVTSGLEAVVFPFVSALTFSGDSSQNWTPLVFSSDKSALEPAPLFFDVQKQWTNADFPMSAQVLGAAVNVGNGRMVVFGDGDFVVNGEGQSAQRLQDDNISLMANSVDFLSDDTGLIALRTKGTSSRPIDDLENGTKQMLKYLNFLLPILLVIGYGIFRMQMKRNTRIKRMEENYG